MDRNSYRIFNLLLAGITGALFLYAGFFYTGAGSVACVYKAATGHECATCGVTRGFHAFLTGHWREALAFNRFALPLFLFFSVQFLGRVALSAAYRLYPAYPGRLPVWDAVLSALLFALTFGPLILVQGS